MPELETCDDCAGEGHYEVLAPGHRQYGSGFDDCEEVIEDVECETCDGRGEVPVEAP